ncbi:hypothetical protein C8J55DRAFT_505503 [Lentinula edodes]|uniref:Uncharacterized protein n=1 Tax=Lentinula lateritia TaxID=40482 RepID=A0A9W9DWR4_9AGAR|nr:hypothetical protein C8J55DRAFT_505503 [Lentinula edodes]
MLPSTLYPARSSFAVLLLLLLSVVFEVMVMATPIAVRNAIANPSQRVGHLKHLGQCDVTLRRRDNKGKSIASKSLEDDEDWYLYISTVKGFYAKLVPESNDQWNVLSTDRASKRGIKLGHIVFQQTELRDDLYKEILALALPPNCGKYKAIDMILQYIGADERKAKGIVFNPEKGDPWQIYTAMTNPEGYTGDIYTKLPIGQKRKKSTSTRKPKPETWDMVWKSQDGGAEGSNATHGYY